MDCSRLRIWRCHCGGSGLIPAPGISTCRRCSSQNQTKNLCLSFFICKMGMRIMFHRVCVGWVGCRVARRAGRAQQRPAVVVRIPQPALVWGMCAVGGWPGEPGGSGSGPSLPLSPVSAGPTLHRPPSSRPCSPTTPREKVLGTAGGAALSECGSRTRRSGTQRFATGSAAVQVSRQA